MDLEEIISLFSLWLCNRRSNALLYIVFKGQTFNKEWTVCGLKNARFTVSNSDWMKETQFAEWFSFMFLPLTSELRESGVIVLFFDEHGSHISVDIVTRARCENVILHCLPPHTAHLLQPLDVSIFGAVKKSWARILKEFKIAYCGATVCKHNFSSLLSQLWQEKMKPEYLVSGFRATGLYPLDRAVIKKERLQTAVLFQSRECLHQECTTATPIATKVTTVFAEYFQAKHVAKNQLIESNHSTMASLFQQMMPCKCLSNARNSEI